MIRSPRSTVISLGFSTKTTKVKYAPPLSRMNSSVPPIPKVVAAVATGSSSTSQNGLFTPSVKPMSTQPRTSLTTIQKILPRVVATAGILGSST